MGSALLGILLLIQPAPDSTDLIRFEQVVPANEPVVIEPYQEYVNGNHHINYAYDAVRNRVFVRNRNVVHRFDLSSRSWSIAYRYDIPQEVGMMEPDPVTGELILWDYGVGRVYRISEAGTATRLDRSFSHMNQFGHGGFVDWATGSIYAIGGYGLFSYKNYITKFSIARREWDLMDGLKGPHRPPHITDSEPLYFPELDRIILAGTTFIGELEAWNRPADAHYEIWAIDLNPYRWSPVRRFSANHRNVYTRPDGGLIATEARTYPVVGTPLAFLQLVGGDTRHQTHHLMALDGQTGRTLQLDYTFDGGYTPLPFMAVFWDGDDEQVVAVSIMTGNENNHTLRVSAAQIDAATLLAQVRQAGVEAGAIWHPPSPRRIWVWALGTVLVLGSGGLWVFHRRRMSLLEAAGSAEAPPRLGIRLEPDLAFEGAEPGTLPMNGERHLLVLLASRLGHENPYVLNDDIDQAIIGSHPSPDYVRKLRNKLIGRLEQHLQAARPLPDGTPYILRRTHAADNRKTEYRLNADVVDLQA